jgi:acylglycerol lipase
VSGFLDAGNDILNTEAKKITLPILYSHGDADPINAFKSTKKAYELSSSTDKELKNWNGLYHECK